MKHRKGFTLIEMLCALGGTTLVLAIVTALLDTVLRMDGAARAQVRTTAVLGRLAEQFRRDVHEATGVSHASRVRHGVQLQLPAGGSVTYRAERGRVIRREGTPAAPAREEWFAVPATSEVAVEIQEDRGTRIVGLVIESPGITGPTLRIEAAVGREQSATRKEQP